MSEQQQAQIAALQSQLDKSEKRCDRLESQLSVAENEIGRLNSLLDSFCSAWKGGRRSVKKRSFWW